MLAFFRKNQVPLSCCFCLLLSVYILTVGARGQLKNEPLSALLMWIMRPLQIAAQGTVNWVSTVHESYDTLAGFRAENERLRKRIQALEVERQKLLEAQASNSRLTQLLDLRSHLPGAPITASIIGHSVTSWFQSCLLDKGSSDGVRKGMAVVTPLGVVGQVVSVTPRTAKVLLLTDANSGIDVLVLDLGFPGARRVSGRITTMFPAIKVIVMPGAVPHSLRDLKLLGVPATVLKKPFHASDLLRAVREHSPSSRG